MRKRNDVGTTHMKENVVQRKQYPSPPTGDVTFRKKEKERARSALEVFRVSGGVAILIGIRSVLLWLLLKKMVFHFSSTSI